jgi:hypothetical protein
MPRYIPPSKYRTVEKIAGGGRRLSLPKLAFDKFDLSVLGLGDVSAPSTPTEAIAAVFDLAGFTNFCKQIEPHLSVPHYLHSFLSWLLKQLRDEMREKDQGDDVLLWAHLPFFLKYLGDGLLVLWDTKPMRPVETGARNVILAASAICMKYRAEFLPTLRTRIVEPPPALRCGVARGTVFSVGEGEDYVGSCINMAARLQKLPGISFCFNRRGFDLGTSSTGFFKEIVIREVSIRGIGEHELICILPKEAEGLSPKDRKFYKEVK